MTLLSRGNHAVRDFITTKLDCRMFGVRARVFGRQLQSLLSGFVVSGAGIGGDALSMPMIPPTSGRGGNSVLINGAQLVSADTC